jgi:hypothetical protein
VNSKVLIISHPGADGLGAMYMLQRVLDKNDVEYDLVNIDYDQVCLEYLKTLPVGYQKVYILSLPIGIKHIAYLCDVNDKVELYSHHINGIQFLNGSGLPTNFHVMVDTSKSTTKIVFDEVTKYTVDGYESKNLEHLVKTINAAVVIDTSDEECFNYSGELTEILKLVAGYVDLTINIDLYREIILGMFGDFVTNLETMSIKYLYSNIPPSVLVSTSLAGLGRSLGPDKRASDPYAGFEFIAEEH